MSNLPIELPERLFAPHGDEQSPATLLLVVVGATLECERIDRPLAYRVCRALAAALDDDGRTGLPRPIPCTDLWYVNNQRLRAQPAIALGRPDVNAGTAYLAARVPPALEVEDRIRIHLDPGRGAPEACVWGVRPEDAEPAVEIFLDRYLEDWITGLAAPPAVAS